jgi:hypothetical protein
VARSRRIDIALLLIGLAGTAQADCLPPLQTTDIKIYLRSADAYIACLQQSDTPDTPPLVRKAHEDAVAATYKAMQQAVDGYDQNQLSSRP